MTRRLLGSFVVATLLGVLLAMIPAPPAQAVDTGLQPGDYVVVSALPAGTHRAWFHGDTADVNAAAVVPVTAGTTTADVDIALPPVPADPVVDAISGTVTDEVRGRPEGGALVGALSAADYRFTAATFTDADGHYRLDVPGGGFYLEILDLDTGHRFEWYDDQQAPGSFEDLTTVTAPAVADAAMTPLEGTVAGTVTEAGSGSTLGGVWVALIGSTTGQPVAGTTTTADGTYRLPAIDIGDYYLVFMDPTGTHALEFHGGTANMGESTPVTVTGGHTTTEDVGLTAN